MLHGLLLLLPLAALAMPSLRVLMHERAVRALGRHGWLLDSEVDIPDFEERIQWILIQVTLQCLPFRQFRILGWVTAAIDNTSLAELIRIGRANGFFTVRETHWLYYFNNRANEAKHRFSQL